MEVVGSKLGGEEVDLADRSRFLTWRIRNTVNVTELGL
jgi:hypothetical protein